MTTCKGPHTEGNHCLQITHFSAAMLDLVGVNVWVATLYPNSTYRFTWVVGKSAPTTFLPIGDPSNILTNIKWIFQQQYSYQLVMLILGCNSPKISCIPRHLHRKKSQPIQDEPHWWNHLRLGPTKPESVASFQEYGLPRVVHKTWQSPRGPFANIWKSNRKIEWRWYMWTCGCTAILHDGEVASSNIDHDHTSLIVIACSNLNCVMNWCYSPSKTNLTMWFHGKGTCLSISRCDVEEVSEVQLFSLFSLGEGKISGFNEKGSIWHIGAT